MKVLRVGDPGREIPCAIDSIGTLRDLSGLVDDINPALLGSAQWSELNAIDVTTLPEVAAGQRIGACVDGIGKFICIGLNFADHAEESNMEIPKEPIVFFKATSAVSGPNDDIQMPRNYSKVDWEVELGVVIGKGGVYISEENAMQHIAGLCVVNDLSERAFQLEQVAFL